MPFYSDPFYPDISFTYDLSGQVLSKTLNGVTTAYTYNSSGLVTEIALPDSRTIQYSYTTNQLISSMTDSSGNMLTYSYDSEGRKTGEEIRGSDDVLRRYLNYEYDSSGRLISVIHPDTTIDHTSYDEVGNIVSTTNTLDIVTSYSQDALNRLKTITAPGDVITTYTYNRNNDPVSVTDANGHTTNYIYDDLGRKTSSNSPDSGITLYSYDDAGNLIQSTAADGITITYEYDALNRLTAKHYPTTREDVFYYYDQSTNGIGHLTGMTSDRVSHTFIYDENGNLTNDIAVITGHNYSTTYTYNQSGQPLSITYPSGRTIFYTYDNTGRITRISTTFNGTDTTIADNISYLPFGPVEHLEQGNGILFNAVFDQQYNTTGQTAGSILDKTYTRNSQGNIVAITDHLTPDGNADFSYDDHGRLLSETDRYGLKSYTYDNVGNRLSLTDSGNTTTYTYATGSNRLELENNNSFSYDPAGRATSITNNKYRYTYNDAGILKGLAEKAGNIFFPIITKNSNGQVQGSSVIFIGKFSNTQYLYDGFDRRAESLVTGNNAGRYHYHYDINGKLLGYTVTNWNDTILRIKEFIWLEGIPVAQADTVYNQDGTVESSSIIWLQTDHLNSPVLGTDLSGNVVWRWDRTAFGTTSPDTDPDGDGQHLNIPLRFPGQIKMPGDGNLYYNWHRFYNPEIGRYITPDPIGLKGGINLYGYVGNDPVNFFDPWGLFSLGDALASLREQNVVPAAGNWQYGRIYSNTQIFDEWLRLERNDTSWLALPKCPCDIKCLDESKWGSPTTNLHGYHVGAKKCVRSNAVGGHANQCCYDSSGQLITHGSGSGSADYVPGSIFSFLGHRGHDMLPADLALNLDGGKWGAFSEKYLEVRPQIGSENCPKNP